jgi:hypothetical protein
LEDTEPQPMVESITIREVSMAQATQYVSRAGVQSQIKLMASYLKYSHAQADTRG